MDFFKALVSLVFLASLTQCSRASSQLTPLRVNVEWDEELGYLYSITYEAPSKATVLWINDTTIFIDSDETPVTDIFAGGHGESSVRLSYSDSYLFAVLETPDGRTEFFVSYRDVEDDLPLPQPNLKISAGRDITYTPGAPFDVTARVGLEPDYHYTPPSLTWMFIGYDSLDPSQELVILEDFMVEAQLLVQQTSREVSNGEYVMTYRCNPGNYEGLMIVKVSYWPVEFMPLAVPGIFQTDTLYVHQASHTGPFPEGFLGVYGMGNAYFSETVHCQNEDPCRVDCVAVGGDIESVELYRMGSPINPVEVNNFEWYSDAKFVLVEEGRESLAGQYTCRARNNAGSIKESPVNVVTH